MAHSFWTTAWKRIVWLRATGGTVRVIDATPFESAIAVPMTVGLSSWRAFC